jgi:hypothetical protein
MHSFRCLFLFHSYDVSPSSPVVTNVKFRAISAGRGASLLASPAFSSSPPSAVPRLATSSAAFALQPLPNNNSTSNSEQATALESSLMLQSPVAAESVTQSIIK